MKGFLIRSASFFVIVLIPLIILTWLYIYFDPFQVVQSYDRFSYNPISPNRDYISTEYFLANRDKYNYNSFIFGSSRATSFKVDSWMEHLNKYASPYAFDASGESLYGIYTKLKFLDKEKVNIDNALLIFCRDGLFENDHNSRLSIKHPVITGESALRFHLVSFKSFCELSFLAGYISYKITGRENKFTDGIIQSRVIKIEEKTNQIYMTSWDEQLWEDPLRYYKDRKNIFFDPKGESYEPQKVMQDDHIKMLIDIREILTKNSTNYKVILSPIYDQVKFSMPDKEILVKVFGEYLYDFTGKNFITEMDTNWYEAYHFRPFIGDSILNIVYSSSNNNDEWR